MMIDYKSVIPDERYAVSPPQSIAVNGIAQMGIYDGAVDNLNLTDCARPLGKLYPGFLKPTRVKAWEAFEISFKQGILLGTIYRLFPFVTLAMIFFDKRSGKVTANQIFSLKQKGCLADSLVQSVSKFKNGKIEITFFNRFDIGECDIFSESKGGKECEKLCCNIKLKSITTPSVVVLPIDKNRPLYTHKELFSAVGEVTVGGEVLKLDENAVCMIDDHKAFYPYHMHYDWLSGFTVEGGEALSFNLTKNQVIEPDKFNENFLMMGKKTVCLPPVEFEKKGDYWKVFDKYGYVDLRFDIIDKYIVKMNTLIFKIDYKLPFGKTEGVIYDDIGRAHKFNDFYSLAEDKTYRY